MWAAQNPRDLLTHWLPQEPASDLGPGKALVGSGPASDRRPERGTRAWLVEQSAEIAQRLPVGAWLSHWRSCLQWWREDLCSRTFRITLGSTAGACIEATQDNCSLAIRQKIRGPKAEGDVHRDGAIIKLRTRWSSCLTSSSKSLLLCCLPLHSPPHPFTTQIPALPTPGLPSMKYPILQKSLFCWLKLHSLKAPRTLPGNKKDKSFNHSEIINRRRMILSFKRTVYIWKDEFVNPIQSLNFWTYGGDICEQGPLWGHRRQSITAWRATWKEAGWCPVCVTSSALLRHLLKQKARLVTPASYSGMNAFEVHQIKRLNSHAPSSALHY